jgi:3-oxoacyl-[acyl-carrier protein] reductase
VAKRLSDKVALITGGARGLGAAAARLFAREGAKVAICDVAAAADEVLGAIAGEGGQAIYLRADVSQRQEIADAVTEIERRLGPIDILVNNAGILRDATLLKMSDQQFDEVLGVNLRGVYLCTQIVARGMVERRRGKIINTSSIVGRYGNFGQTNYAAAKAGVIGMTKVWARELGPKGINVNAVAPGFIRTEMALSIPPEALARMQAHIPMQRMGEPLDVAYAYLFFASSDSDYVNGAVLGVDGGMLL